MVERLKGVTALKKLSGFKAQLISFFYKVLLTVMNPHRMITLHSSVELFLASFSKCTPCFTLNALINPVYGKKVLINPNSTKQRDKAGEETSHIQQLKTQIFLSVVPSDCKKWPSEC